MTNPVSAFGAMNRGLHRFPDTEVIFENTFEDGFEGWRDHMGGSTPYPALGLTSHPVYNGSRALMLSVGKKGTSLGLSGTGSAYKNLSRFVNTGKVTFEGMFTIGGANLGQAPASWALVMDVQQWDNSSRGFYSLVCDRSAGADPRPADVWSIGKTGGKVALTPAANTAGDNENKHNWNFVSMTIDLDANSGLGGYYSATINDKTYDLTGLGAGRGDAQTPQTVSGVGAGSFAGGLNFGITLINRYGYDNAGPSWLVADQLRGIHAKAGS